MPNNLPEDDNEERNFEYQEIPFLASHFVQEVDELISLAHYGPTIVIVSGEDGVGKSVVIEQLENETSEIDIIRIDGNPMLGVDQLHASFLQQLGCYDRDVEFNSVRETLLAAAEENEQLILVDDAQQLATSALETLLSLVTPVEQSPSNQVRLFLFGNQDLESQINISGYPENAVYKLQLCNLTKEEMIPYIGHKLNISASSVEESYGKKQLNSLWKISKGNPGKLIEELSRTDLEEEFEEDIEEEENALSGIILRVILTILGIGLLVLAIFGENWLPNASDKAAELEAETIEIEQEDKNISKDLVQNEAENEEKQQSTLSKFSDAELVSIELGGNSSDETVNEEALAETTDLKIPMIENQEELLTEPEVAEPELLEQKTIDAQSNNVEIGDVDIDNVENYKEKSIEPVIVNTSENYNTYSDSESRLLEVSSERYSIQLVGLSQLIDMEQFVKTLKPINETFIYRSLLNGQPWYILVTGDYPDAETARNEKDKLQTSMKNLNPWIKPFTVIQQQIKEANNNRQ